MCGPVDSNQQQQTRSKEVRKCRRPMESRPDPYTRLPRLMFLLLLLAVVSAKRRRRPRYPICLSNKNTNKMPNIMNTRHCLFAIMDHIFYEIFDFLLTRNGSIRGKEFVNQKKLKQYLNYIWCVWWWLVGQSQAKWRSPQTGPLMALHILDVAKSQ